MINVTISRRVVVSKGRVEDGERFFIIVTHNKYSICYVKIIRLEMRIKNVIKVFLWIFAICCSTKSVMNVLD